MMCDGRRGSDKRQATGRADEGLGMRDHARG